MKDTPSKEEEKFNDTIKRMLKTPPDPKKDGKKVDDGRKPSPEAASKNDG